MNQTNAEEAAAFMTASWMSEDWKGDAASDISSSSEFNYLYYLHHSDILEKLPLMPFQWI